MIYEKLPVGQDGLGVEAMRPLLDNIPVFYSERMLAETRSFSPSAGKPRHVLDAWHKAAGSFLSYARMPQCHGLALLAQGHASPARSSG